MMYRGSRMHPVCKTGGQMNRLRQHGNVSKIEQTAPCAFRYATCSLARESAPVPQGRVGSFSLDGAVPRSSLRGLRSRTASFPQRISELLMAALFRC
jgi:hypothetical protein